MILSCSLSPHEGYQELLPAVVRSKIEFLINFLKDKDRYKGRDITTTANLAVVLPGAAEQTYHQDHSRKAFYYTLIFPLTDDPVTAGRTVFFHPNDDRKNKARPTDCLVFNGKAVHKGTGNGSNGIRCFLYVAIYSGVDFN